MPETDVPRAQWLPATDNACVSVLEVVVPRGWDAIADIFATLHELRAQALHAVIAHIDDGASLRYRLHVVEFDGGRLDQRRGRAILAEVESCLMTVAPTQKPPATGVRECVQDTSTQEVAERASGST